MAEKCQSGADKNAENSQSKSISNKENLYLKDDSFQSVEEEFVKIDTKESNNHNGTDTKGSNDNDTDAMKEKLIEIEDEVIITIEPSKQIFSSLMKNS